MYRRIRQRNVQKQMETSQKSLHEKPYLLFTRQTNITWYTSCITFCSKCKDATRRRVSRVVNHDIINKRCHLMVLGIYLQFCDIPTMLVSRMLIMITCWRDPSTRIGKLSRKVVPEDYSPPNYHRIFIHHDSGCIGRLYQRVSKAKTFYQQNVDIRRQTYHFML